MFDSVGRDLDDEALQRSAKSAGLVTLLSSGGVAAFLISSYIFVTEIAPELPMPEIIMEEFVEEAALEAPPPPPPPPPPAAAAAEEETEEEEVEPTPDEMVDKVEELKDEVKEEMKSDQKPAGVEGGQEGGKEGGVVGGVQGGVEGGVIGGTGSAPPPPPPPPSHKTIRSGEVEWKIQTKPSYPEAARGMGYGETACVATVFLSSEGVVEKLQIADTCPKPFQTALQQTVMKWRAYPYKVDGQKIAVSYKGNFVFKEN